MLLISEVKTDEQYNQVINIRKDVFIQEQGVDHNIEIDSYEKSSIYFLGTVDNIPIVTGRLRLTQLGIKFERIATVMDYRKKGYGTQLMSYMQNYCLKRFPNKPLYMYAQVSAVEFYQKLNWKIIGDKFVEAGIEHRKMLYNLN